MRDWSRVNAAVVFIEDRLRSVSSAIRLGFAVICGIAILRVCLPAQNAGRVASPERTAGQSGAQTQVAVPELVDITASTGIRFKHLASPDKKYIVESMSGGVTLIDYDRDGWPDIYFTNAPDVDMQLAGKKARSALFHNDRNGTFTDVTEKAGVSYPCWAYGAVVGDYNNDGWPDLFVTCFGGVVLYRNNGGGTFTNVTKEAGLAGDTFWAMGAAFGDYDNDGDWDLAIVHHNAPAAVLRNDCDRGHWLKLKAIGRFGPRTPIGLRVTLRQGTQSLMQELAGGTSYCSAHESALIFGVGQSSEPCDLEIRWPKGKVQRLEKVSLDQTLLLLEPDQ